MSRSKAGMGGGKSGKSRPHEIHVKRAHGGGFIATHHKKKNPNDLMNEEPQEHVLSDVDQLKQHLDDHMGDQPPAGQGGMDQEAPQAAPQPPMAGM